MKKNTKGMTDYNIARGQETRERVIKAIEQCKKEGDMSTTRICELAGVDRSYFTRHPEMRKTLETARGIVNRGIKKRKQNTDSRDVLERTLYADNDRLKKKIASLEKDVEKNNKYKAMYDEKCIECENLKKQVEEAYRASELLDF